MFSAFRIINTQLIYRAMISLHKLTLLPVSLLLFAILLASPVHGAISQKDREETYKQLETFANVLSILQENYVEEIDTQEAILGAINGLLFALDPHSSYLQPENFEELHNETQGSFTGIGIEITIKDGNLTVVAPIEGTPADKAGIMVNDTIVKIEGEWTNDMTPMNAVKKLRGPKGTPVTISIHRQGWKELKDFNLTRDIIPLQSVKSFFLSPGMAYMRISNFQAKTTQDFKKSLKLLKKEDQVHGLILDLRNNPGGLLNQAVNIADIFLNSGLIVYTKGRTEEQNMAFNAHDSGEDSNFPLVVLVNEGSASASEIVAGALQDHKRAIVLGTQTFGKGSVQTIVPLHEGAGLRLTTAHYFTPNGRSIQAKGITPDITVPRVHQIPSAEEIEPEFPREKNLRNHFLSIDSTDTTDSTAFPELDQDKEKEKEKIDVLLAEDNQLRTALNILKSLNLFSEYSQNNAKVR